MLLEPVLYTRACADGNYGDTAAFGVEVKGGTPSNYTYQWYYSASLTGGEEIPGAIRSSM